MLTAYIPEGGRIVGASVADGQAIPENAPWIDLKDHSAAEFEAVERRIGAALPSPEEIASIEVSSRLQHRDGALFMTALLLSEQDSPRPISREVTFVLTPATLVTLRRSDPKAFAAFTGRIVQAAGRSERPEMLLCGLWQAIIARSADVLERLSLEIERAGDLIFRQCGAGGPVRTQTFRDILSQLGAANDLTTRIRESMFSLSRVLGYPEQAAPEMLCEEFPPIAHRLRRDVAHLSEHTEFLSSKIAFLLDATLGMINVEQNAIIRILSIVATMFLPPTLIASLYGMNFAHMPELSFDYGYPMALGAILLSALIPALVFKLRGWL